MIHTKVAQGSDTRPISRVRTLVRAVRRKRTRRPRWPPPSTCDPARRRRRLWAPPCRAPVRAACPESARRRAGPGAHSIFTEDFELTRRGSSYISLIAHISPRTPQPHTYTSHTLGMGHIHRDRTRRAPLAVHTAHSSAQPAQASCRGVTSGQGTALASRTAHPRQGRLATPLPPPLRGRHADPTQPKATLGPLHHSIPGARFRAQ